MVAAARFPELDTMICYELQAKYEVMRQREVRYEAVHCDDAEIVVVAYGIMARIAKEAVKRARAKGVKAGLFRPITIFPFPEEQLAELASTAREVLVTEMNFGQALVDVRLAVNGRCPVQFLGQPALTVPVSVVEEAIHAIARSETGDASRVRRRASRRLSRRRQHGLRRDETPSKGCRRNGAVRWACRELSTSSSVSARAQW